MHFPFATSERQADANFLDYLCIWPYSKCYYFANNLVLLGFPTFCQLATQQPIHHL